MNVAFPWYGGHPDDVNRPGGRFVVDAEVSGGKPYCRFRVEGGAVGSGPATACFRRAPSLTSSGYAASCASDSPRRAPPDTKEVIAAQHPPPSGATPEQFHPGTGTRPSQAISPVGSLGAPGPACRHRGHWTVRRRNLLTQGIGHALKPPRPSERGDLNNSTLPLPVAHANPLRHVSVGSSVNRMRSQCGVGQRAGDLSRPLDRGCSRDGPAGDRLRMPRTRVSFRPGHRSYALCRESYSGAACP